MFLSISGYIYGASDKMKHKQFCTTDFMFKNSRILICINSISNWSMEKRISRSQKARFASDFYEGQDPDSDRV